MAQWTNTTNSYIRPYRHPSGSIPMGFYEESTCASSAVIQFGDVVSFDTVVASAGHRIVRAPSSGGSSSILLQVGITSLVGVAAQNSTSDGSTTGLVPGTNVGPGSIKRKLSVYLADPETEFLGYISSRGGGGAAAPTLVGTNKALVYDDVHHRFFVDSTNSTAALAAVRITDIPSESVNDTNGPVIFKFLSSNVASVV